MDRRARAGQGLLQRAPPLPERLAGQVAVPEREQVEGDEVGRGALREQLDPALGRMDPLLQRLEVEASARGVRHDDLPVDDAALGEARLDGRHDLGEVAVHRPPVAAADLDLVAVPEDDRAEPVPLGLVAVGAERDVRTEPCEHRCDRWHDRQVHEGSIPRSRLAGAAMWIKARGPHEAGLRKMGPADDPSRPAPGVAPATGGPVR